jgi:ABC-type dipeptide/oligopeptide/nickel transport system permease subunit
MWAVLKPVLFLYLLIASIGGSALFATVVALYFHWIDLASVGEWLQLVLDKMDWVVATYGLSTVGAAFKGIWPRIKAHFEEKRVLMDALRELVGTKKVDFQVPLDDACSE